MLILQNLASMCPSYLFNKLPIWHDIHFVNVRSQNMFIIPKHSVAKLLYVGILFIRLLRKYICFLTLTPGISANINFDTEISLIKYIYI